MPAAPRSVTIRSFQVGFGDCFLLSFAYDGEETRNVLVDFGTTGLPNSLQTTPGKFMPLVAEQIATLCGRDEAAGKPGKLHAVVATHRHADHISGFATDGTSGGSGTVVSAMKPDLVVQPWTEDPDAAEEAKRATTTERDGTKTFLNGLAAMNDVAAAAVAFAQAQRAKGASASISASALAKLEFVGADNVKNVSAVENLIAMGDRKGAKSVYANYGSTSGLEKVLPGVQVTVLGPPTLEQSDHIKTQRSRDPTEFWQLLAGPRRASGAMPLADGLGKPEGTRKGTDDPDSLALPPQVRWFARHLSALRGTQVLEIVTALDQAMNNTSLILLFEFGGRKLLFPGDAQLENWSYALRDVGDAEATRNVALLSDIDFYKVGHHGSLNATPKKMLWSNLTRRNAPKATRLRTMMSTMPGKHPGKVGGIGEVPRRPLVDALEAETVLTRTDDLKTSKDLTKVEWFQEVTIDAEP